MVVEEPQAPSNLRRESFQSGHGRTGAASRLGASGLGGIVGRDSIRVEEAGILLIAHHYRTRARRYLGCIGAFSRATLTTKGQVQGGNPCAGG